MENNVNQKIKNVLSERNISITSFSKSIGEVQTTINRQLNGTAQLSAKTVESFLLHFPDISAEWLLRGKGDMYLSEASSDMEIEALKAELNMLKGENNVLREQLGLNKRVANVKSA